MIARHQCASALLVTSLLVACTSTMRLDGESATEPDGGANLELHEDAAVGDAAPDAANADLPVFVIAKAGNEAQRVVLLEPGKTMPRLSASATGEDWPCSTSAIAVDAAERVAVVDVLVKNDQDREVMVRLGIGGSADGSTGVHRGEAALALYDGTTAPVERRDCRGVMKVDCVSTEECGDRKGEPVTLAVMPFMNVPKKSSFVVSVFAVRPSVFGPVVLGVASVK